MYDAACGVARCSDTPFVGAMPSPYHGLLGDFGYILVGAMRFYIYCTNFSPELNAGEMRSNHCSL